MTAFISMALALFLFFFSNVVNAKSFGAKLCAEDSTRFSCYKVQRKDTWNKLFPDSEQKDLVMRLNRINVSLERGMIIAVPKNLANADKMDFAPFPKQIEAPGEKIIKVSLNPKVLAWGAYDAQGNLTSWGPVSGGKGWCPDIGRGCHTSMGKFNIYRKAGSGCVSSKFPVGRGGAPMPYCMFFNGGFALHGSYDVPGYNASHGCVRIFVPDAKWLNQEFLMDEKNVPVIISNQT